jgi:hypothetical protein
VSTESIASPPTTTPRVEHCSSCGATLAPEQRYCLECGERCVPMSSVLAGGTGAPSGTSAAAAPPGSSPTSPHGAGADGAQPQRSSALTVIAGVGVLLLAMGVGVLIGRSSIGKQSTPPAQVIDVGGAGTSTLGSSGGSEATFSSDWPAGSKGFTVQLQTLPSSSSVSAVEAAKSAATAKGAKSVGALKAEEFSSLTASGYVIYSGDYPTRSAAQVALTPLKKSFPVATVVEVSNKSSGSSASGSGSSGSGSSGGVGSSLSHPAPPSVLQPTKGKSGKSFEEKSKNLPDVVGT